MNALDEMDTVTCDAALALDNLILGRLFDSDWSTTGLESIRQVADWLRRSGAELLEVLSGPWPYSGLTAFLSRVLQPPADYRSVSDLHRDLAVRANEIADRLLAVAEAPLAFRPESELRQLRGFCVTLSKYLLAAESVCCRRLLVA